MSIEHVQVWQPAPPVEIQAPDAGTDHPRLDHPKPDHSQEKVASSDMLLLGMMVWMEQGVILDWLKPKQREAEERQHPRVVEVT